MLAHWLGLSAKSQAAARHNPGAVGILGKGFLRTRSQKYFRSCITRIIGVTKAGKAKGGRPRNRQNIRSFCRCDHEIPTLAHPQAQRIGTFRRPCRAIRIPPHLQTRFEPTRSSHPARTAKLDSNGHIDLSQADRVARIRAGVISAPAARRFRLTPGRLPITLAPLHCRGHLGRRPTSSAGGRGKRRAGSHRDTLFASRFREDYYGNI